MDRFKKILVAASPGHLEPFALRAAVRLADDNDAHLTVLDVFAPLLRSRKTVQVEGRVVDIKALLRRDREEQLRRLVQKTRGGPNTDPHPGLQQTAQASPIPLSPTASATFHRMTLWGSIRPRSCWLFLF
jgi:hypothetical protein